MTTPQRHRRGMSTAVSHVLSVGITTLLVIALVSGATGFLDNQSERTVREELNTIGNRLAGELDRADTLGRQGDSVAFTTRHPETVAGSTYTARLEHGAGSCRSVSTTTCLRLSATEYDYEPVIAVDNETTLELRTRGGGRFAVRSARGTGTAEAPTRTLDLSARVGIGGDVGAAPPPGVGASLARKPIARFTFRPGRPSTDSVVTFDAGGSTDPDGSIDEYAWDFDSDGTYETTGMSTPTVDHTFGGTGWHNVTLKVTDDTGATGTHSRNISVSGLEYVDGSLRNVSGSDRAVEFRVRNRYARQIAIERVLIDPADDSLDEVSEARPTGVSDEEDHPPHEIEIDRHGDGSVDGYVDWDGTGRFSSVLEIPSDGAIVDVGQDGDRNGGPVFLAPTDEARITIRDFAGDVRGEDFTLGVRYRVGSNYNANVFADTVTP